MPRGTTIISIAGSSKMRTDATRHTGGALLCHFRWAFLVTAVGLVLGGVVGWNATGTVQGTLSIFFICAVLAMLEISLSFDNAIVNANKLKSMSPVWQRRFLTWGILIAVFGMRILFPLAIVAIAANVGPWQALVLAVAEPDDYARIMNDAHLSIAAFGGAFLLMVGLSFFFDAEKDEHWVRWIETRMARAAGIRGFEILLVLALILAFAGLQGTAADSQAFLGAAVWGLLTFLAVEALGALLDSSQGMVEGAAKGGLGAFLYLEVLDASFSFDGVIGAFALSQNLLVIAIGLGIGAMYVRSMTIMLVEQGTLKQYCYLEHGAFYAVIVLSVLMFAQSILHVPELVTGLGGVAMIGLALWSSVRRNRALSC